MALKRLVKVVCKNNEVLSNLIIPCCLKNICMLVYEDGISYLEVLKELVLINDDLRNDRRDCILGVPTLEPNEDNFGKVKFGLKGETN